MSVKRYELYIEDEYPWHAGMYAVSEGDELFVLASDYDELRKRVAWMLECDDWYNGCFMYEMYNGPSELYEITLASRLSVVELL